MKKLSALLAVLSASVAFAQPSISQSDMPSTGDTLRVSYALSTNNVDHTLTGANYVWNFSTLIPISQQVLEYKSVSTFPFIFTASHSVENPSPDSLPFIGSVPTNFTDYYKNGSSGYRQIGSSFDYPPLASTSIPIIYASEDYIYEFPLQYNDIDSSIAAFSVQLPGFGFLGQKRNRRTTADGWGTLTTPFGTFQALRIRSEVQTTDTIFLDSLSFGISTPRPLTVEYKWLATGGKIPILQVDAQVLVNNTETVTRIVYRDSVRANTFQVGIPDIQSVSNGFAVIYPNPPAPNSMLMYQLDQPNEVQISIYDMNGRLVFDQYIGNQTSGMQTFSLPVDRIDAGIYLVQVRIGQSQIQPIRWLKQ
jgi:hypothetical protein